MIRSLKIQFLSIILFLMVCGGNSSFAQTPSWAWANKATTLGGSIGVYGFNTDAAGNNYTVGIFNGGIQFGSLQALPVGMFLVKHTAQGNPVWSLQANCQPAALATDSA